VNARFFESVAKTILWADVVMSNRKYHDRMFSIFANRNIAIVQFMALSAPKCHNKEHIIKKASSLNVKLADVTLRAQGLESNPLYDVHVNIPTGEADLYDCHGNCYDCLSTTEDECIQAAQEFVEFLHFTNSVGPDSRTPWEIRKGNLVRTRTCCCFREGTCLVD
jgi:hypothetical protein